MGNLLSYVIGAVVLFGAVEIVFLIGHFFGLSDVNLATFIIVAVIAFIYEHYIDRFDETRSENKKLLNDINERINISRMDIVDALKNLSTNTKTP
jgi:hypothetical protein